MAFYQINYFTFSKKSNFHNFLCNFSLHEIAADLAIQATSKFLNDIRSTVGDDIFAKFSNLKSERSLALVIDVSGSMSGEPISSHLIKAILILLLCDLEPLAPKVW